MRDLAPVIVLCRQLRAQGKTAEDLLSFLRGEGCSKVESIIVLARVTTVDLQRAKEVVHLSEAWKDRREADDAFQADLEDQLGKIGDLR